MPPTTSEEFASELGPQLRLRRAQPSRRRLVRSHWYWLERAPAASVSR